MNIASKVKKKLNQSGVRGVVGSALRLAANRVDSNEAKQVNEISCLGSIRYPRDVSPGKCGRNGICANEYATWQANT